MKNWLVILLVILFILPTYGNSFGTFGNLNYVGYGSENYIGSDILHREGLLRKSEYELIKMIKLFPKAASIDKALLLDAENDALSGNMKVARSKLEEFIETKPNSPLVAHAALQRAFISFENADFKQAEYDFYETRQLAQNDYVARVNQDYAVIEHEASFWQAVSMSNQGRHQEAIPIYLDAAEKYESEKYADDALFMVATIKEMNRKNREAIEYYKRIIENYPNRNTFLISKIRLANNHLLLREYSAALIALESAEATIPNIEKSLDLEDGLFEKQDFADLAPQMIIYLKGESYNMSGNYQKGLITFQTFLETYNDSEFTENSRLGAGWALLNLQEAEEALKYYDKVIENIDDDNFRERSIAQLYRTVALKELGKVDKAQDELSALSVQPTYPFLGQVLLELGQIYYEKQEYDKARRTVERGLRESTDAKITVRLHLILGAIFLENELWSRAASEYKKAENIATNSTIVLLPRKEWYISESRFKQGIALVKAQRSADAIQPLLAYIATNPDDKRTHEAYFWLAESYYNTDMLNSAAETYDVVLQQFPNSPRREQAYYGKGWSYFRMKDFRNSSSEFDQMIKEFPKSKYALEVLTRQGDGYYLQKNYRKAADSYARASRIGPGTDEGQYASYQLCHALYRSGQLESAINSLLDFIRQYNDSPYAPNAMYLVGWIKFQQRRYDEAIDNFLFLQSAYPQSSLLPRSHYAIGDAHYNAGNFESAIAAYRTVVEEYPASALAPEALRSIQYSLLALGREEEAIDIAGEYIESNPESPFVEEFQLKRAEMFYSGKKFDNSAEEYKNFIDKNPDSDKVPEVIYWMGKSYAGMKELEKAEDAFNMLVIKFPEEELAGIALLESGIMYKNNANATKADSLFLQLRNIYPKHEASAQAGFELAVLKIAKEDTLAALELFRATADSFPNLDYGDQSRYQIARYYRNKDMNDSALYHFNILAEIQENAELAALAQYRVGELYMKKEMYDQAVLAFKKVIERFTGIEDWFTLAHLSLGEAYENMEDAESAAQVYTSLIAIRPDEEDDYHKTAKARLERIQKTNE